MDEVRRKNIIRQLCEIDMVEMKPTGQWGLTTVGREFLDQLDVLRELDDRPAAAGASLPLADGSSPVAAPGGGARKGTRAQMKRTP